MRERKGCSDDVNRDFLRGETFYVGEVAQQVNQKGSFLAWDIQDR